MARGYRNYRGRRTKSKTVPIILAALLLIFAFIFLFLSVRGSIVFSSEGIILKSPFSREEEEPSPSPFESPHPELIIVSPSPSPTLSPSPTPTPKQDFAINAAYLPGLSDATATAGIIQLADNGTINAVVIDMKHDDGTLSYASNNQNAIQAGTNTFEGDAAPIITELKDSGLYLIARVSAFKDNIVPRKTQSLSVKVQSGVIWLDRDYHGWLNPYIKEAQDYVTDISLELADMGFDEIYLENCVYPTIGRPQLIAYGDYEQTPKVDAINAFLQNLSSDLNRKDTLLSVNVSSNTILTGTDSALGHDTASLYYIADRIYTDIGTDQVASESIYDTILSVSHNLEGNTAQQAPQSRCTRFVPIIHPTTSYDSPDASESIQAAIDAFVQSGYGWLIRDNSGLYPSAGW